MALVTFSFSGTTEIKVTGGATAGTLSGEYIIDGMSWRSSLTSKGSLVRLTDNSNGRNVIVDGTKMSYDANLQVLPHRVKVNGIKLSMPASIIGVIYLRQS